MKDGQGVLCSTVTTSLCDGQHRKMCMSLGLPDIRSSSHGNLNDRAGRHLKDEPTATDLHGHPDGDCRVRQLGHEVSSSGPTGEETEGAHIVSFGESEANHASEESRSSQRPTTLPKVGSTAHPLQ